MKPCGIIATYMCRQDWQGEGFWVKLRTMIFNLCLFIGQLTFMIVGTAIGKVNAKIKKPIYVDYILAPTCIFGIVAFITGVTDGLIGGVIVLILLSFVAATLLVILTAIIRGIDWPKVWRAAQCSHVRLVLERAEDEQAVVDIEWGDGHPLRAVSIEKVWRTANFGYPKMEIQLWCVDQIDGKHFRYFDPTFPTPPEFMEPVIQYAEDQVGKPYDTLQLFSYGLNFIVWLFWWPLWGREVLPWLNLRGGREVCSSGITADLRWADNMMGLKRAPQIVTEWGHHEGYRYPLKIENRPKDIDFFRGYDTAMVSPCLIVIDRNWEE